MNTRYEHTTLKDETKGGAKMNQETVMEIGRDALMTILLVAGPIMAAGLLVGLIIALFQALTTIQEMTLTFVPKILVTIRLFDRMIAL